MSLFSLTTGLCSGEREPLHPQERGEAAEVSRFTSKRASPWVQGQPVESRMQLSSAIVQMIHGIWMEKPGLNQPALFIKLRAAVIVGSGSSAQSQWRNLTK